MVEIFVFLPCEMLVAQIMRGTEADNFAVVVAIQVSSSFDDWNWKPAIISAPPTDGVHVRRPASGKGLDPPRRVAMVLVF